MRKISPLLLVSGLAIADCHVSPIEKCANKLPKEIDLLTGSEGFFANRCEDMDNKKAREHCTELINEIQRKIMSACITRRTHIPHVCNKKRNKWRCRVLK